MAEKKFSQLTAKGATIADTDLVAISESAGGGSYTSKSVTGANIKALVTDANLTTTDVTTNDVSTSKHGFAPKAPNDTTKFLRGDGSWAVPSSGGLTNFTEAENTSAPNATVYVDSLTAAASSTDADFAILPKGTGALLGQVPDNAFTKGNKRGQYATDWQRSRNVASRVASGAYSTLTGGQDNTASGNWSTAGGASCTASSSYSTAFGFGNTASFGASALGYGNTASGQAAFSAGDGNTASGNFSSAIGATNTASGLLSFAFGSTNTANGAYSNAQGRQAHVFGIHGRQSYASGQESTAGDSQISKFILRERTTNDTATTLTSDSGAASTTNQVILQNQNAFRFKGTIIGKQSGSTNVAAWDIDGLIVRGANAASTTLIVSNVNVEDNTPTFGTPTLAADTTNGGLRVQVTGVAATNIQWTARIETTEVIYA